jgi:hypothetical protein
MEKQILLSAAVLVTLVQPAQASAISRRADIIGGGGAMGRCTIEVNVDGAAEVEISADTGWLRTVSGQQAYWRRFQCNAVMPRNPADFRFIGIDGRGLVRLLRDPRSNGGQVVVRIDDRKGGRASYTFDLQWRRTGGGASPPMPHPIPSPAPSPAPTYPPPGHGAGPGFPMARVIRSCQDAVTTRLNRDGYPYVTFEYTAPDNTPGRNDWVIGNVSGRQGYQTTRFSFSCGVDFRSGTVRSVDIRRR